MMETRNAYRVLSGEPFQKRLDEKLMRKYENNVNMAGCDISDVSDNRVYYKLVGNSMQSKL
jgi:hypothetical protein